MLNFKKLLFGKSWLDSEILNFKKGSCPINRFKECSSSKTLQFLYSVASVFKQILKLLFLILLNSVLLHNNWDKNDHLEVLSFLLFCFHQ